MIDSCLPESIPLDEPSFDEEAATTQMLENEKRVADGEAPQLIDLPLTSQQLQWIRPHLDWAAKQNATGKPGMLLALIAQAGYPTSTQMRVGVRFVPHEIAISLTAK